MGYHAGLDWGGAVHTVCVVDEAGRIVVRFEVRHDAEGIAELIARLARIAPSAEMPIAIERPSGLLVAPRGRPPGRGHPSERRQGLPAALPRRRWQERSGGRLHPRRHPAHRRPSLPAAPALLGRDPGVAGAGAQPRRPRRRARRPRQSSAQPARRLLARRGRRLRPRRIRRSRSPSCSATRRPTAPHASARSAWPPSSPSTATAAAARPPSCSAACAPPPPAMPARPRPKSRASSSARWPRC